MNDLGFVAALGFFDGVHIGHQALLAKLADFAPLSPMAVTFTTVPKAKNMAGPLLTSQAHKEQLLLQYGAQVVVTLDFAAIAEMDGPTFLQFLHDKYHVRAFVCGQNFRFGKGSRWGYADIESFCRAHGLSCFCCSDVRIDGELVSSTRIRSAMLVHDEALIKRLLGRQSL